MAAIDNALIGVVGGAIGARANAVPGPRGPRGRTGRAGRDASASEYPYQGIFFDESRVQNLYVSTTGSDVTGNGQSPAGAFATVNRALREIPNGWTADVWINVIKGNYAGNQTWDLIAMPGAKSTGQGTGRVAIVGDLSEGTPLTGGAAGVAVAGTLSQFTFNVGAFVAVVGNGTHYVYQTSTNWLFGGSSTLTSVSPNLALVAGGTTALASPTLQQWISNFTGSVTINIPGYQRFAGTWFAVAGIHFGSTVTAQGVSFRAARFSTNATLESCALVGCTVQTGTTSLTGIKGSDSSFSTSLVVAGSLSLQGVINSVGSSTWLGAAASVAKLCLGGTSATLNSTLSAAFVRQFFLCDFRGTGNAVIIRSGSQLHQGGTSAACTMTVTGGAGIVLDSVSHAYGGATWTWTGTSDTGATLANVSHLLTAGGYAITTGGATDIKVGDLASTAVAVRPQTDPDQLCRYT